MRRRIRQRLRSDKGQTFVEFAFVLPIALVLIFGVVELGKATSYWLDSSHLANEGARYAAVDSCPLSSCATSDATAVPSAIKCEAETDQLKNATTVYVQDLTGQPASGPFQVQSGGLGTYWQKGNAIRVIVASTWPVPVLNSLLPLLKAGSHLADIDVTGKSTMRLESTWASPPAGNQIVSPPGLVCS
jgi:Flp pilus assembly protein TadG